MIENFVSEKSNDIEIVPERYKYLASLIGVDQFITLAQNFGGTMLYIPKHDSLTKEIRDESIRRAFNGGNYKELAKKYNLCESQIRNIINSDGIDGQMTLFG